MTTVQRVAQIFGVVFTLIGIAGFFVTGTSMNADMETAPRLLGLFPVNMLHNIVHLLFGIWGILASRTFSGAKTYAMITGVSYIALTALGFVMPEMFGLIPIGGNDIWLHALIGISLLAAAMTARDTAAPRTTV